MTNDSTELARLSGNLRPICLNLKSLMTCLPDVDLKKILVQAFGEVAQKAEAAVGA
jgi:hypothetical protein